MRARAPACNFGHILIAHKIYRSSKPSCPNFVSCFCVQRANVFPTSMQRNILLSHVHASVFLCVCTSMRREHVRVCAFACAHAHMHVLRSGLHTPAPSELPSFQTKHVPELVTAASNLPLGATESHRMELSPSGCCTYLRHKISSASTRQ